MTIIILCKVPLDNRRSDNHRLAPENKLANPNESDYVIDPKRVRDGLFCECDILNDG
jgi:hypothetical protein